MAYNLTNRFQTLLNQRTKSLNLILEIDGIPIIYSSIGVTQAVRIGMEGLRIGNDWVIGGQFQSDNNRDVISLKDGTTRNLTQQIQEDKSASTSVKSMNISLVDKDFRVSDDILNDTFIDEVMNRRCTIYLGLIGGVTHPEDSVRIFAGNISDVKLEAGLVKLLIQAPETLKRQDILSQYKGNLAQDATASDSTIYLEDVSGLTVQADSINTYVRINDEIIKYEQIDFVNDALLFCDRGQLNSVAATHETGDDVESIYQLYGNPLNLVLGLLTGGPKRQIIKSQVTRIDGQRVYFVDANTIEEQGVTIGDDFRVVGSTVDTGLNTVADFGFELGEAYIETDVDLGTFTGLTDEECEFFSQYRLPTIGAGIETSQIDVAQFEKIQTLFGAGFPDIDIYVKDNLELQPFIDEILYSIGAISLERKGRISITYSAPPLADGQTRILTNADIVNPDKIQSKRSVNSRFYNVVEYAYDEFSLTEDRQRKNIRISADSQNRIAIGKKVFRIDARGLRADARDFIEAQSRRYLDRYKFGAESFDIRTTFRFGFPLEVGDVILFAPENLRIWDYNNKSFNFVPRMMEIVNKNIDYTTGACRLTIADTNFGNDIRFSTIGPASYIDTGSTTTLLKLKKLVTTDEDTDEGYKWENFEGQNILIRNEDYTYQEIINLVRVSATNGNELEVTGLVSSPSEDLIIELPGYDSATDIQKALHGFICPKDEIQSVANQRTFDVADGSQFFTNCLIDIYNNDYSVSQVGAVVESVAGNTITLTSNADVTLVTGLKIGRIGFASDQGNAYGYY